MKFYVNIRRIISWRLNKDLKETKKTKKDSLLWWRGLYQGLDFLCNRDERVGLSADTQIFEDSNWTCLILSEVVCYFYSMHRSIFDILLKFCLLFRTFSSSNLIRKQGFHQDSCSRQCSVLLHHPSRRFSASHQRFDLRYQPWYRIEIFVKVSRGSTSKTPWEDYVTDTLSLVKRILHMLLSSVAGTIA